MYKIASLPKPLDAEQGIQQAAPVYGLHGSQKRKRREVVVGTDGEGVTIYNVQSQIIVASYALPPQSFLCCPPCSIHRRPTKPVGAQRKTYLALRDGATDAKRRLVCFTEHRQRSRAFEDGTSAPTRKEVKLRDGAITNIEVLPVSSMDIDPQILVSYVDGTVICVDGSLTQVEWEQSPDLNAPASDTLMVEYAALIATEAARKGLLRSREDVIAQLDSANDNKSTSDPALLCRIVRTGQLRHLQLFAIRGMSKEKLQIQHPGLQQVMSYEVSLRLKQNSSMARYELHPAPGLLCQLLDGHLRMYDLSGTLPRIIFDLGAINDPVISFARISLSSMLAIYMDRVVAYDTKYGSIRQTTPYGLQLQDTPEGKKEKRPNDAPEILCMHHVTAFADIGLVVGLRGGELAALPLRTERKAFKRGLAGGIQLIDVLGKGTLSAVGVLTAGSSIKKWESWRRQVDGFAKSGDVDALEHLVAQDFVVSQRSNQVRRSADGELICSSSRDANGVADPTARVPPTSYSKVAPDLQRPLRRKATYLLSRMFILDHTSTPPQLELKLVSWKLLRWLLLAGYLSVHYIRQALQQDSRSAEIAPGDLLQAIQRSGHDFLLMHDLLQLPAFWEADEIVQALNLLVQSFEDISDGQQPTTLSSPSPYVNGDTATANGDAETQIESESLLAERELTQVRRALDSGLEIRSETFHLVLNRLHAFPQRAVTSALRKVVAQRNLIFLVHILRIELADGGWTSQYVDGGEEELAESQTAADLAVAVPRPSDYAIRKIVDLLLCAIDAIGIGGWMVGLSGDVQATPELVESLKEEARACMEGCEEAVCMVNSIAEVERFAGHLRQMGSRQRQGKRKWADREEMAVGDAILPLGSRPEPVVIKQRLTKKGEKKSQRTLAREKGMSVGKYSIEAIRF